jgi:Peptidase A4 family
MTVVAALAVSVVAVAAFGAAAAHAGHESFAALRALDSSASANWSGYVVSESGTTYTSVTATWKEPKVTCGAADAGESSAFWVGLGGASQTSQALEQTGTSADCDATTGRPSYYAWYELVPAGSVTIKLAVHPGDTITTSVNVLAGTTIELQVKNRTRHTTFTKKLPYATPDLTSAEWIAEAPSACDKANNCRQIPLSNFGTVSFTKIAALGNAVGGTLTANPGWTATAISLVPDGTSRGYFPGPQRFASRANSSAGATPSTPSTDGRSFAVQFTAAAPGTP